MNIATFTIIAISLFIAMLSHGLVMPLLPLYATSLGANSLELGFIAAGSSFASLFLMPFIGAWSDRYGRKIFICIALFLTPIAILLMSLATSTTDLIVLRCLQGIAMSMLFPTTQALLADMIPPGQEGKWMGYFNMAVWGGLGLGPVIGGAINDLLNMAAVFYITSAVMFLSFLVALIFLSEPPRSNTKTQKKLSGIRGSLQNKTLRNIAVLQLVLGLGMGASLVFLPILGNINLALTTTMIGIILAVRTPISMIQSWTGKMADRWGALRLIIIGGALNVIAFVLLPWSIGFWTLLIFHALLSLGTALTQPAIAVYVVKEGRFSGMGSAMSISMMATQLGMGIGPILMGRITDYSTISIGFNSIAGLSLIGLILFAWNMHKHHPTD